MVVLVDNGRSDAQSYVESYVSDGAVEWVDDGGHLHERARSGEKVRILGYIHSVHSGNRGQLHDLRPTTHSRPYY